jgi:hypothetical protein
MMGAPICTSKGRWEHSKQCGKMIFFFGWWQGCQVDLKGHEGDDECKLQEFMAFQDVQLDYPICFD